MDESQDTDVLEKLLITIVQKILRRSLSLLTDEILHSWNILQLDLNQIHSSLTVILALLQDAEDSTLSDQTKPFSGWLEKLKDVAYEAEDVLDDLACHDLQQKVPNLNPVFKSIDFLKSAFSFKLARKVKTLNDSLREIRKEAMGFLFDVQSRFRDRKMVQIDLDRVTDLAIEDTAVGRETDVSKIVSLLSSCGENQDLTVVPIVGFHGLGKTTLAKLVCEQAMARKLFDVNIWLCCSQTSEEDLKTYFFGKLSQSLNEQVELSRKKFLLVLDNCSIDDCTWWNSLKTRFSEICSNKGNAVLVTSSNEEVAIAVGTLPKHRYALGFLSDEECWLIMKERAFRNSKTEIRGKLEEIGRDIARYCRGVPLIAKVIGGTMGFNMDEETWLRIRESLNKRISDDLLSPLVLSFDQLPSDLKLSLLYSSYFPRGISVRKEVLIQLWMVGGFVDSCHQGNKFFSALLENSFFYDVVRGDDGDVIGCKIPDFLPYFASHFVKPVIRSWMIPPAFNMLYGNHMYADFEHLTFQELRKLKSLRTLNFHGDNIQVLPPSIGKLRHLRYLSASNTKIKALPKSITTLCHLQTLDLSNSNIKTLPRSIFMLCRLKTLKLSNSNMVDLPKSIKKLHHLENLNVSNTGIKKLPTSISKLQSLQTLNISNSRIKNLPKSITKLHHLENFNASNTSIKELPKSISKFQNLQTLNVSNCSIEDLPESMASLQNLKTLNVSNSNIVELPEFITKLETLQTLNVSKCDIKEFPESITNLSKLQTLKFLECKKLTMFPKEATNYLVNLKNISFSYEHQMPFGLGHLTSLQTLPFFVVGQDFGGSIGELKFLNELRGHLEITRLEEVQDKEEAKRANLQGKTRLGGLGFHCSNGSVGRISRDEELLECLQPNPNIRRLKIKHYMGKRRPSWMCKMKCPTDVRSMATISNLVELELEHCWNCEQLPCLGDHPYLKFLRISHMRRVKCIDNHFYGINTAGSMIESLQAFPSLKLLSVSWMEGLTEWISPSGGNRAFVFPCLEILSIQSCAKLACFPFSDLSAVVKIQIKDCEELRFIIHKQQPFPYLNCLSIVGCPKLTELRDWLRSKMGFRDFIVRRCQWLIFVPRDLGKLSFLTSLGISCCDRLKYFPEEILGGFTQLKHLSIGAFSKELDDFRYLNRINELPWLEELEIWGSDVLEREMSILPDPIQGLRGLKSLKITGFTTMEVLPEWLVNLQSLRSLSLNCCRNLGFQFATVIVQLPGLADLYIRNCPVLEDSDSEWLQSLKTKYI